MAEHADITFTCMGCDMRVLVEDGPRSHAAARGARRQLEAIDAQLSRFREDSELARLNADPRLVVPASPLLRAAVRAAIWAAEASGGLVDPTLLGDLEHAGYRHSLTGIARVPLAEALKEAPPRAAARPRGDRRWRAIRVDDARGTIARPPGLRIDTGGTTKGLAADAVAHVLGGTRHIVDCAGDLRLDAGAGDAFGVIVEHPLTRATADTVDVRGGAIATSGPGRRLWRDADGAIGHHLLDAATGAPAWTGLVSATALAPTALEAETLAKAALLGGPTAARRVLARRGGVLIHDDGATERVGPIARPRLRLRTTERGLAVVL
ncbi:MAG TPA: FAD:protein FMN transferase [Thermoleophilaceae bacterium]|jgi:thiamine biosynthesis lipoprotein